LLHKQSQQSFATADAPQKNFSWKMTFASLT